MFDMTMLPVTVTFVAWELCWVSKRRKLGKRGLSSNHHLLALLRLFSLVFLLIMSILKYGRGGYVVRVENVAPSGGKSVCLR